MIIPFNSNLIIHQIQQFMKKILLILLTVLLSFNSLMLSAQETLTVADGSESNSYVPFYGLWMDAMTHSQVIYPASMLTNLNGATIISMTFYLESSPSNVWGCPFNIQLGETVQENYGSSVSYIESGLSSVYTGQVSIANAQMTITFSSPYTYQGGNLVLDVQNTNTGTYSSAYFYGESTTQYQGAYAYGTYSPTGQSFIPKTTFSYLSGTITCHAPSNLIVSGVNATDAMISWTASEDAGSYVVQYKTASQTWDNAQSDNVSDTYYDLTGLLTPVTHYDVRVATDCGGDTSFWKTASFTTSLVPENLPYTATFGENDNWMLNNGTNSNYWVKGTVSGVNALFVTNDGSTPGYNITSPSSVSAEKHIVVGEAGTIAISFDLQCGGEGTTYPYDYMKLFLAPMNVDYATSTSWTSYSDGTYAADFSAYTGYSYQHIINLVDGTLHVDALMTNPVQNPDATSVAKLVFGWRNDSSSGNGESPVITNLQVTSPSCDRPSQPIVSNITAFTADVAWEAPSDDVNDFYVQYVPANMDWDDPDAVFENVAGTSIQLSNLEANTTYQLRVATNCYGDTSLWRIVNFTTPATCYPPVNVTISQVTGTSAMISWEDAFYGANDYTVEYSIAGEENWNTQVVDGTLLMLSNLQPNTAYDVMVYSNCDLGTADTIEIDLVSSCLIGGVLAIGDGTNTSSYYPTNSCYNYSYTQQLFTPSELGAASDINSVSFKTTQLASATRSLSIYMMHTNASNISSGVDASAAQMVYNGSTTFVEGWTTLHFTNPFAYNGTDNLVLIVLDSTGSYVCSNYYETHNAFTDCTFYAYNDGSPYDIATIPSSGYSSNQRNNVIFGIPCDSTTTCASPNVYTTEIGADNITVDWAPGYTETAWDMEYMAEGDADWTSIGSVTAPYELTSLDANTVYTIRVRSNCGGGEYSEWRSVSARTECTAVSTLPYIENFDSYGTGSDVFPLCWQKLNTSYSSTPYINSTSYQGNGSLYFYTGDANTYNIAVAPEFDASVDLSTLQATFMYKATYTSDKLLVGVMSDPTNANTFVVIDTVYPDAADVSTWVEREVNFSGYDGTDAHYIAFKNEYGTNYSYAYIDNLSINTIATCHKPSALTVSNIDLTSATLSWTEGDVETEWDIEYGPVGFTHGDDDATIVHTTTNPLDLTDLTAATSYDVYVRADCGGGEVSDWILIPVTFSTTVCPATEQCEYTFIAGDSYGDGWNGGSIFVVQNGITVSTVTAEHHGGGSIQSYDTITVSLCGDFPTQLVWYAGSYASEVSFTLIGPDGSVLTSQNDMSSFSSYDVIDTFTTNCSGCMAPGTPTYTLSSDGTSATITWTAGGEETAWVLEYQAVGESTWTVENIQGIPSYTINNLIAATGYVVRVKSDCGGGDESGYKTITFFTPCDIVTVLPYTENFDNISYNNANAFPLCWARPIQYLDYPYAVNAYQHSAPASLRFQSETTLPTTAVTPQFAEDIHNLQMNFWLKPENLSYSGTFEVGVMTDPADVSTFVGVWTIEPTSTDWAEYTLRFDTTAVSGVNKYIAFRQHSNSSNWYYWLDDVEVSLSGAPVITDPTVTTNDASAIDETSATLNATINNPSSVAITAQGFEWKTTTGGTYTQIAGTGTGNSFTANLTGLTANTSYTFKAFITFNGNTVYGDEKTFTTQNGGGETCNVPTNVTTANVTYNAADVTWTAGGTETAWNLQYRTGTANWTTVPVTATTYHISGLAAQTTYEVRVQANCGNNNTSDWTTAVSFTTPAEPVDPCDAPTGLTVSNVTANSATATWTAGGSETAWNIQYKLQSASQWQEATVQTTSYDIEGLTASSTYEVRVKAICSADNQSDFVTTTFTTGVGIDNITLANSINLMPNPADNYIDLTVTSNVTVKEAMVYNAFGQMIQKIELNDNHARIDLSDMAAGMYFVRVNGDNVSATKKFIKR